MGNRIDFTAINTAATASGPSLLKRWLPIGRRERDDWVALNPRRNDRHLGSFRINVKNGRWIDFATGDKGGDFISLVAYLDNVRQSEAAVRLARILHMKGRLP